jgi:hypothetical protein
MLNFKRALLFTRRVPMGPWVKRFGDFSDALPVAGCSCAVRAGADYPTRVLWSVTMLTGQA